MVNSRVEVAYREAVALKRQEELIREEEAAEKEQVAKKEQADKDRKAKKKQVGGSSLLFLLSLSAHNLNVKSVFCRPSNAGRTRKAKRMQRKKEGRKRRLRRPMVLRVWGMG